MVERLNARYRGGAPPSPGTDTGPGMAYLRECFHYPGVLPPGAGDNR